jgi:hypothetical protein
MLRPVRRCAAAPSLDILYFIFDWACEAKAEGTEAVGTKTSEVQGE